MTPPARMRADCLKRLADNLAITGSIDRIREPASVPGVPLHPDAPGS